MRLSLAEAKRLGLKIAAATPAARGTAGRRRKGRMPEDVLWMSVRSSYPKAVREYQGAVPGRRFRIDLTSFALAALAIVGMALLAHVLAGLAALARGRIA